MGYLKVEDAHRYKQMQHAPKYDYHLLQEKCAVRLTGDGTGPHPHPPWTRSHIGVPVHDICAVLWHDTERSSATKRALRRNNSKPHFLNLLANWLALLLTLARVI